MPAPRGAKKYRDDLTNQISDLDVKIVAAQKVVDDLKAQKASVKSDKDDIQAYIDAQGG